MGSDPGSASGQPPIGLAVVLPIRYRGLGRDGNATPYPAATREPLAKSLADRLQGRREERIGNRDGWPRTVMSRRDQTGQARWGGSMTIVSPAWIVPPETIRARSPERWTSALTTLALSSLRTSPIFAQG